MLAAWSRQAVFWHNCRQVLWGELVVEIDKKEALVKVAQYDHPESGFWLQFEQMNMWEQGNEYVTGSSIRTVWDQFVMSHEWGGFRILAK